jgi:GxxExxY protein
VKSFGLDENSVTEKIIGSSYKVHNFLGTGHVEKVYENALAHELRRAGLFVKQQERFLVYYHGIIVGDCEVDLLINDRVIVEVKALSALSKAHEAQVLNYLKVAELRLGLLLNFGSSSVEVKRKANGYPPLRRGIKTDGADEGYFKTQI